MKKALSLSLLLVSIGMNLTVPPHAWAENPEQDGQKKSTEQELQRQMNQMDAALLSEVRQIRESGKELPPVPTPQEGHVSFDETPQTQTGSTRDCGNMPAARQAADKARNKLDAVKKDLDLLKNKVDTCKRTLEDAKSDYADKKRSVRYYEADQLLKSTEDAEDSLRQAQNDLLRAQTKLADAKMDVQHAEKNVETTRQVCEKGR